MKSFNYYNPVKINYEFSYLKAIDRILRQYSEILVVTTCGTLKRLPDLFSLISERDGIDIVSGIDPNPQLEVLQQKKQELKKYQCILAIGGGSVMDSAKFFCIDDAIIPNNGELQISSSSSFTPIFAIPTTSGTSSELTKWATVWDSSNCIKYSLNHEKLYPYEAFYDTHLMMSLSRNETINGALDTLSHAFESIWNKNNNPISTNYAIMAIEIILETLPRLLDDLASFEKRKKMVLSNIYAGLAFSNTQTALAHALSYPITMKLDVPHGIACSITLPILMQNMKECEEKAIVSNYIQRVIALFHEIGISTKLDNYGITQGFVDEIFSNLNSRAKNGLFDVEEIKKVIKTQCS